MGSQSFAYALLFAVVAFCSSSCSAKPKVVEFDCLASAKKASQSQSLPQLLTGDEYKANVVILEEVAKKATELTEYYDAKAMRVASVALPDRHGTVERIFVGVKLAKDKNSSSSYDGLFYIRQNGSCTRENASNVFFETAENNPYRIGGPIYEHFYGVDQKKWPVPWFSLSAILAAANNSKVVGHLMKKDTTPVGDYFARHWRGCFVDSPNKSFVQFDVAFAPPLPAEQPESNKRKNMHPPALDGNVLLQIKVGAHKVDGNRTDTVYESIFDVSFLRDKVKRRDVFEPPRGTYCEKMPSASLPPIPEKFAANIAYRLVKVRTPNETILDKTTVEYYKETGVNGTRLTAFSFDHANRDQTYVEHAGKTSVDKRVRTVQDFKYGLQYDLTLSTGECNVSSISSAQKSSPIGLRKPVQFLLPIGNWSSFANMGTRDGSQLYTARETTSGRVLEVLFAQAKSIQQWGYFGEIVGRRLVQVVVYDHAKGSKTVQDVIEFDNMTNQSVAWNRVDVLPCLTVANNSFVLVVLKGAESRKFYQWKSSVENELRTAIAKAAGVSPLRVSDFFYRTDAKTEDVTVFFLLADKSNKQKPNATVGQLTEISAAEALKSLNRTLSVGDVKFDAVVEGGKSKSFTIGKGSLEVIPPSFQPAGGSTPKGTGSVTYNGFGWGSVFFFVVFSLFIGGVLTAGSYYMYKRRVSGAAISYSQVYE